MSDQVGTNFKSLCHATAMRKAARHLTQMYDAFLAPSGLRSTQRSVLVQIGKGDGLGMTALAELLVLDRTALSHNLKPLIRDGLVEIGSAPSDKRAKVIRLTALGKARIEQTDVLWRQAQSSFEVSFGDDEAASLRDNLARVASITFPTVASSS